VVHSSSNVQKAGLWKIHPDGSDPTRLVTGRVSLPDVSPDGRHVLYRVFSGKYPALLRVVRVADGQLEPFEIAVDAKRRTTVTLGRARWLPDGKAIAFIGQDEDGAAGVYVQDFAPGRNTEASRRKLTGFDPDVAAESFGIAPDGARLVLAGWLQIFSLMEGEGLSGLPRPASPRADCSLGAQPPGASRGNERPRRSIIPQPRGDEPWTSCSSARGAYPSTTSCWRSSSCAS
jgi:hypothetical protein